MIKIKLLSFGILIYLLNSCGGDKLNEKGFSVNQQSVDSEEKKNNGISNDSVKLETRPFGVHLTAIAEHRLTTVYMVNYRKKDSMPYIGSDHYYSNYGYIGRSNGNNWHENFMPGIEAVYGYNMVNVAHYNITTQQQKDFFNHPALVKTLYYPSFSTDTLNNFPVNRNYYMISVYNEDTNKDGFINLKDLRRFYYFDINAENKKALVPENYSVISSEYDPGNDFMYVFAQLDNNENGRRDNGEDIHVFWIDLGNPKNTGKVY